MEIFDDDWGAADSGDRALTNDQTTQWWVSRISLPEVTLFDATGKNLSKIGTDAQLLTGAYEQTRIWALRIMNHPVNTEGILYASRHDIQRENIALFQRSRFLPETFDRQLDANNSSWARSGGADKIIYGPAIVLKEHPELPDALGDLEVGIL